MKYVMLLGGAIIGIQAGNPLYTTSLYYHLENNHHRVLNKKKSIIAHCRGRALISVEGIKYFNDQILHILDLRNNCITSWDFITQLQNSHIRTLNLDNNCLATIPSEAIALLKENCPISQDSLLLIIILQRMLPCKTS